MHPKRFEELKATGLLPSPTGVGLEILRLTRDEKSTAQDIARVLRADPALTGRTLRLANTGSAAASRRVTNIADAVVRLGTRTVSAIALGFTILAGNRSSRCQGFDYQRFWSHSLASAVSAQVLCSHTHKYASSDGFTAGLLAQVGRLALGSIHSEKYAAVLTEWAGGTTDYLVRLEQQEFLTDHNELGGVILADWGLPPTVSDAVSTHENPPAVAFNDGTEAQQLARILHAATRMADVCVAPNDAHARGLACDLVERCEAIGIDPDTVAELFDRICSQWAEWGRVLDIKTHKPPKLADLLKADKAFGETGSDEAPPPAPEALAESPSNANAMALPPVEEGDPGLLVLVADPDATSLRFLEKFLVLSGHRVRCATDGEEALQVFFETAPQLVIVNAELPEIGGLEFCRRLRQTTAGRQAYVIMLTPPDDEATLVRLFEAGVDDFVTKPFAARPLFARIRASLRVVALQEKISGDRQELERIQSELSVAYRRLELDALTDVLTGLPNRRYLIDRLAHDWAAARRGGTPLACMMIDIDNFKSVNDTHGHDVGDAVLKSVAALLQTEVRGNDVVCRYGGEEFVVLSGTDLESALRCAERLRTAVESRAAACIGPLKERVTVSIGVAVRNDQTRCPDDLIKVADEALFHAKRSGRNRVISSRDRSGASAKKAERPSASPSNPAPLATTR
jgi:diguanylate cyclase (GGDEF)-like protein